MKKYIVLSVNDNPTYLFYLPLTVWAWRKFGWEPIIFKPSSGSNPLWIFLLNNLECQFEFIHKWNEYPSEMLAQISRLYAGCIKDGYLMTGDIDMIPLSDYWKFDENEITTWGRDLTNRHYPICYIGMNSDNWKKVMNLDSNIYSELIKKDLDSMPNAKSEDPEKRWCVDQDLITDRLDNCGLPITKVFRGSYENGYPIGRVDRSAWTKNHEIFIDAHLPRGIYNGGEPFAQVNALLHWIWPDEDFTWFYRYIEDFKKLSNG